MPPPCQSGVWRKQDFCAAFSGDLNGLETSGCYNGAGLGNAPTGDWLFVEVMRHYNTGNYYVVQRASGMTGAAAGQVWVRSQQSASYGAGWGPWTAISGNQNLAISGQYDVGQASSPDLGWHKICFVSGASGYPQGGIVRVWPAAGPDANGKYYWQSTSQIWNGTANVDFWVTCMS